MEAMEATKPSALSRSGNGRKAAELAKLACCIAAIISDALRSS